MHAATAHHPNRRRRAAVTALALASLVAATLTSTASPLVEAAPAGAVAAIDRPAGHDGLARADRRLTTSVVCGAARPVDRGLDPSYVHLCSANGLPVVGSAAVDPAAVRGAAQLAVEMVVRRPDLLSAMIDGGTRVGVIATTELATDLPEHRRLDELLPGTDRDARTRGVGATPFIPLSSVGEENVRCLAGDPSRGESIMVREFARTVRDMALVDVDPTLDRRIDEAYLAATSDGRWAGTVAATSADEYWAELTQSYFDADLTGPPDGQAGRADVSQRDRLAVYDPRAFEVIDAVFAGARPVTRCPVGR